MHCGMTPPRRIRRREKLATSLRLQILVKILSYTCAAQSESLLFLLIIFQKKVMLEEKIGSGKT